MNPTAEEEAYEKALSELKDGTLRQGLWIKAMAHSEGDEGKARAAYLKFRAEQITRDISAARKAALIERGKVVAHDALLRTRTVLKKALIIAAILFVWLIICVAISAYNESR